MYSVSNPRKKWKRSLGFKALFLGFPEHQNPTPNKPDPFLFFLFKYLVFLSFLYAAELSFSLSVDAGIQGSVYLLGYYYGRTRTIIIIIKIKNQEVQEEEQRREAPTTTKKTSITKACSKKGEFPSKNIPPLVAYFPSGYNPCKTNPQTQQVEGEEEEGPINQTHPPRVKFFRNMAQRKTNRLQVVVSPSGSNVDFVGSSYSGEAAAAQVCRYSLGVLDKENGTLKIVPIASNKILRLEPRVRSSETANKDASNSVKSELTAEKNDKLGELTVLYGTKKDRKKRKDFIDLKKEVDPESQKALDKKIEQITFDKEALGNTSALIARNIPPHDSSATMPLEAYPLDKIILKGDWEFLGDIYELLQVGAEVASNAHPGFVCNRIHKLDAIQIRDETERWKLSCVFLYITHLVKFKDMFSMEHAASAKNHKIPSIIRQRFFTMFTDPGSKLLSSDNIYLLISYVLVITLHADGFRTDPSDIAKDLRISVIGLRPHFVNLGCKLLLENNILYATLPVPLKFPSENLKGKRRQ